MYSLYKLNPALPSLSVILIHLESTLNVAFKSIRAVQYLKEKKANIQC